MCLPIRNYTRREIETMKQTPGQRAYNRELQYVPNYDKGVPRKTWEELDDIAKASWEKNPTPRKLLKKVER